MKNQGIPEHKMNFTGDVGQALENTTKTSQNSLNQEAKKKQNNQKNIKL